MLNAYLFDDEFVALSASLPELENKYIDSMSFTAFADGNEMTLQDVLDTYGYSSYIKPLTLRRKIIPWNCGYLQSHN